MTLENAKTRANEISAERLIDVVELADNLGFIARFTSDKGLRVFGQTLISHDDSSFGLVILNDGTVAREAEAQRILMPQMFYDVRNRTRMICAICGSPEILADAYAAWDVDKGSWELHCDFDAKHCPVCELASSAIEVDEATQLEIQVCPMVADNDGSRRIEGNESPDWFDIIVTTTPFESGVILTLEEHEDLSADDATAKLAELVETYPLAPVSSDDCDLSG